MAMTDETLERLLNHVQRMKATITNLETGLRLGHELATTHRTEAGDAIEIADHILEAIGTARLELDRLAGCCLRELEVQP